jgi:uncharacterized integral membrane protein
LWCLLWPVMMKKLLRCFLSCLAFQAFFDYRYLLTLRGILQIIRRSCMAHCLFNLSVCQTFVLCFNQAGFNYSPMGLFVLASSSICWSSCFLPSFVQWLLDPRMFCHGMWEV